MTLSDKTKQKIYEDFEQCKDKMYGKLTEKERKKLGAFYTEMSHSFATSLVWQMNGSKIRIVQSFQRLLTNYIETKKGNVTSISFLLNKHN